MFNENHSHSIGFLRKIGMKENKHSTKFPAFIFEFAKFECLKKIQKKNNSEKNSKFRLNYLVP